MKAEISGSNLVITIPIEKKPSSTGKTNLVANSHGAKVTDAVIDGKSVYVNVTAYTFAK